MASRYLQFLYDVPSIRSSSALITLIVYCLIHTFYVVDILAVPHLFVASAIV